MNNLETKCQFVICILFLLLPFNVNRQVSISPVQDFNFGTIYPANSGGTTSISTEGLRSSSGDIVPLSSGPALSQAIFEIEAPVNTTFSFLTGQTEIITGNNGGTMILKITGSEPDSPFFHNAVSPARSTIHFSGELTVGALAQTRQTPIREWFPSLLITNNKHKRHT